MNIEKIALRFHQEPLLAPQKSGPAPSVEVKRDQLA